MSKYLITAILLLLFGKQVLSQPKHQIDSLLSAVCLTQNSKDIIKSKPAKKLMLYGKNLLPTLVDFFKDTTLTLVKSDCQGRFLNRGEVAIIIADHIELMPYFTVTGIQNCTLEFCPNNPNLIEFYLNAIKHDGMASFCKKYTAWLNSDERKKWPPYSKTIAKEK
jgi:hypothetical protein